MIWQSRDSGRKGVYGIFNYHLYVHNHDHNYRVISVGEEDTHLSFFAPLASFFFGK